MTMLFRQRGTIKMTVNELIKRLQALAVSGEGEKQVVIYDWEYQEYRPADEIEIDSHGLSLNG